MSVIINGTSGITNDATDLNYTGTLTGGTGVVNLGSGQLVKDASGNLGLGVTPSAWVGFKAIQVQAGCLASNQFSEGNLQTFMGSNVYFAGDAYRYIVSGSAAARYAQNESIHSWHTAPSGTAGNPISFTQAMTLESSGNLLVGTTSTTPTTGNGYIFGASGFIQHMRASGAAQSMTGFYNGGNLVGEIRTSTTATAYNTSSDYRLKHDIAPMTDALARVALLKPCTYKWKVDGSDGQGFIAHELQAVVPDCVTGEKDAVDSEGKPQYQGIDTSFLVATLTAAIQEQQAIIQSLTTRITALEAK